MKEFLLFLAGLAALIVLVANLGPMVFLGLGIWLLYIIFKQFMKSDSTIGKIGWVILGLIVLSITISNMFALIGVVAAIGLYFIYKSWKKEDHEPIVHEVQSDDPFTNFEREWAEINHH
ncbi:MAG: flagellar basal body rod protein [Bacillota bacterium]